MANESEVTANQPEVEAVHVSHPTPLTYFKVAMTLVVLTAIEVLVFFFEGLGHGIIPILAILSLAKFVLVAMFYMHLKFDHKLFSTMFAAGSLLAFLVVFAILGLFKWFV